MAYIPQMNQDDEQQQQAAQGPQQTGPQSSAITGTAPAGGQQTGQKKSFNNINQYLQQNQPQSAKLGEKVGGYVGQQLDSAQQGLQQGQEQFNQKLEQNKKTFNSDLVNQAGQDPTKLDQSQFGQLKGYLSGAYEGPQGLDENIFNQSQKAVNTANLGGSEEGRKQLLQQVQKPGRSSAGVSSLNNLLLQNNPQAQAQIMQKQEQAKQLQKTTEESKNQAAEKAQAAKLQNQQVANQTKEAFTGEQGFLNKFKSGLDAKTQAAKAEADKRSAQAQALLKGGTDLQMTPEARAQALADIGISEDEYSQISKAYNPNKAKDFGFANYDTKRMYDLAKQYASATGDNVFVGGGRQNGSPILNKDKMGAINDWFNQQNKYGKYAQDSLSGTKDLTEMATIGGYNQDMNALRQQVASKDDLAKQQAFNDLLGLQENYISDDSTLGTFNADLVNFDRLRAGLK